MDRINSAGVILDQFGHRIRQDMNLQTGAPGTELSSAYDNSAQEELIGGLIEAMGLTPSAENVRQIQQAIWTMIQRQTSVYALDTSETANQITIAPMPAISTLFDGQPLRFKAANSNSGAVEITVGTASGIPLNSAVGALQGGEIVAGCDYEAIYSATTETAVLVGSGGGAIAGAPATQTNQFTTLSQMFGGLQFTQPGGGWQRFPSGLILQFGAISGSGTVTFPVSFTGFFFGGWVAENTAGPGNWLSNIPNIAAFDNEQTTLSTGYIIGLSWNHNTGTWWETPQGACDLRYVALGW